VRVVVVAHGHSSQDNDDIITYEPIISQEVPEDFVTTDG
jgi:hypothetical protein